MADVNTEVAVNVTVRAVTTQAVTALRQLQATSVGLGGSLGLLATGVGLLAGVALLHGVQSAVKFQEAMELIHTQAGATQQQVGELSKAVEQLAMTNVGMSAEQLAGALYHVESAMQKTNTGTLTNAQAMNILKYAAEGARVGLANINTVANAMIGIMVSNIGGIHGAGDAIAWLNAIVGAGNVHFEDLAASIGNMVLPAMANAGLTIADFGAAMATATDNAVPAEMAATRLRMTISLMVAPSAAAVKQLESIGMGQFDLARDLRKPDGLLVAVDDLISHLEKSGKTAEEQNAVIDAAFGRSRGSAMIHLLIDEHDRLSNKYKQEAAAVSDWAATYNAAVSTVMAKFDQFKNVIGTVIMVVASGLLPVFSALFNVITPVVSVIGQILITFPLLTAALGVAATSFAILNLAIIGGRLAMSSYEFGMRNALPVISHLGSIVNATRNLFASMIATLKGSATAQQIEALRTKEATAAREVMNARILQSEASERSYAVTKELSANKEAILTLRMKESATSTVASAQAQELLAAQRASASADIMAEAAALDVEKAALAGNTTEKEMNALQTTKAELSAIAHQRALELEQLEEKNLTASINDANASLEMQQLVSQRASIQMDAQAAATVRATVGEEKQIANTKLLNAQKAILNVTTAKNTETQVANSAATVVNSEVTDANAASQTLDAAGKEGNVVATQSLTASIWALVTSETALLTAGTVLVPVVGYLAYQHIPAFHKAVNDAGDYIQKTFEGILLSLHDLVLGLTQVMSDLGDKITWVDNKVKSLGIDLDALGSPFKHAGDAIGGFFHSITGGGILASAALAIGGPIFGGLAIGGALVTNKFHEMGQANEDAIKKAKDWGGALKAAMNLSQSAKVAIDSVGIVNEYVKQLTTDWENKFQKAMAAAMRPTWLAETEAAMTMFANGGIMEAKRMSAGMISEFNKAKAVLASPMPEMRVPGVAQLESMAGSTDTNLRKTTTGQVLSLDPAALKGLQDFQGAIKQWPEQYRAAFDATTNTYKQAVTDAYNTYIQKYNDANRAFEEKVKAARSAAQQKMDAENQRYEQKIQDINQTHENHIQTILQNFETQFQTALANFQAAQAQLQTQAEAASQRHQDAMNALQSKEQEALLKVKKDDPLADVKKAAIIEGYQKEAALEDKRYQGDLRNIDHHNTVLTQSFDRHVKGWSAAAQNKLDAENRNNAENVTKANQAHKNTENGINTVLKAHISGFAQVLADSHTRFKHVFDEAVDRLAGKLNHMNATQQVAAIDKATQDAYNKALNQATADILNHGKATKADIAAMQYAAGVRDKFTKAQAEAAAEAGTSIHSVTNALNAHKNTLTNAVANAEDQYVHDLIRHTGNLTKDAAAINKSSANLEKFNLAVQKATDITAAHTLPTVGAVQDSFTKILDATTQTVAANTAVIAAEGAIAVGKIEAVTTAIQGQTAVLTSMDGVAKASTDAQVKAIQDQSAINKSTLAVLSATNPQELAVAQAQLQLDQDNAAADKAIAAANLKIANDELKAVQDRAAEDNAVAVAQSKILEDTLKVDMDKVRLAQDGLKLADDQLRQLVDITKVLGGATTNQKQIGADESSIAADNFKITTDEATQQADQNTLDILKATNANTDAQDALTTATDKSTLATLQNAAAIQAAQDAAKVEAATARAAATNQLTTGVQKSIDDLIKVTDAQTAVIKTASDVQVAKLDAMASAITDQTDIIKSQEDIAKATTDQQVKAIADGASIFKAQLDVQTATDSASLAVAQAALKLEQDKMHFDQMAASAAVVVAQQGLFAAQDKARLDAADNALKVKIAEDTLAIDQLKVTLAQDQLKVSTDALVILSEVAQALGVETDYSKLIADDQKAINKDNQDIAKAMQQQAIDQAKEAQAAAQAKVQEATDQQNIELAKAAQAQVENTAAIQEAKDQAAKDAADAVKSAQQNTSDTIQAMQDTQQELRNDLQRLIEIEARGLAGLARLDVTNTDQNMMNGWASDAARSVGAG